MVSPCRRYVISFNGEIYNHLAMRNDLEHVGAASAWRGSSDTETLLAAVSYWGLHEALRRAFGMFALALWDRQAQQLHLARDRMGEKPLYLARLSDGWAFGSELKALLAVPNFQAHLCSEAVAAYLTYGYVSDRKCIFQNVQKVQPGHVTSVSLTATSPVTHPYETFGELIDCALKRRDGAQNNGLDELETTLTDVVGEQMLSDVPLGCFLSGGVDSSLVAALMQSQRDKPISTFSIGFDIPRFNEAPQAAAVAQHLKTDHTEFILSEDEALAIVPQLARIYDEPFADSSQIPTALLCREARKSVTVALSGDGGDEVFGGYNRYIIGPKLLQKLQLTPRVLRRSAASTIHALGPILTRENSLARRIAKALKLPPTTIDKAVSLAPMLPQIEDHETLYRHFTQIIANPSQFLDFETIETTSLCLPESLLRLDVAEWMMAMDSISYLPGDILVKVDRAAMASSLETRAPFLDARVINAAWNIPQGQKINSGQGKQVLRQILDRHVPRALIDRPKQGFAVPLDSWLRGGLREWAEVLLKDRKLFELAGLAYEPINHLWLDHQNNGIDHGPKLWCILMLLSWLREYETSLQSPVHSAKAEGILT